MDAYQGQMIPEVDDFRSYTREDFTGRKDVPEIQVRRGASFSGPIRDSYLNAATPFHTVRAGRIIQYRASGRTEIFVDRRIVMAVPACTLTEILTDAKHLITIGRAPGGAVSLQGERAQSYDLSQAPIVGPVVASSSFFSTLDYDASRTRMAVMRVTAIVGNPEARIEGRLPTLAPTAIFRLATQTLVLGTNLIAWTTDPFVGEERASLSLLAGESVTLAERFRVWGPFPDT